MPQDRAQKPNVGPQMSDPGIVPGNDSVPRVGTYFLGRYRVVDEIGIGGMASVHLARMDGPGGFQKWVAVKRIHPHLVEDDSFVHMFLDEARVAARISHPNVAQVSELGKHEDTYWIAMEYLHGEPLREVMRRTEELGQPMPPEIACRVIADAAEGLHAAHELLGKNGEKLGLVHRDVTPHNLFVTYDGTTKVVDFGIAKFSSRMAQTRAGTLKGKLAYMSPEQVQGEPVDRRTDLFALGVVLWELTTGQRLFRMESDLDTLAKVQECNVPRPSTMVRGYPIDLEKIVMKALAKTKAERYRTAREFSRALQSLLMRRGLFIASDEVAQYMQSIFADRIHKREAHLRWAAEVTQTINLDAARGGPPSGSSAWSNDASVLTYDSGEVPNPATMRAVPRPAAGAPPGTARDPRRDPAGAALPSAVSQQSAPTAPRGDARQQVATVRPPIRKGGEPQHPALDDGPTLARPTSPSIPIEHPAASELPTMRASPHARENEDGYELEDEFDDDDGDDTIITTTRPDLDVELDDSRPQLQRPTPPTPLVVAPRVAPPRTSAGPALPPVLVTASLTGAEIVEAHADHTRTGIADGPFPSSPGGTPSILRQQAIATDFPDPVQHASSHHAAEVQRLFSPPLRNEQLTVATQPRRKRTSLWIVGAVSAVLGLLLLAVAVVLYLRSSAMSRSAKKDSVPTADSAGVFSAARTAFSAALSGAPTAPPPTPQPSAQPTGTSTTTGASTRPETTTTALAPTTRPTVHAPTAAPTPTVTNPPVATNYGTLTVICRPACEQVLDSGVPLGGSPVYKRKVAVGSRRVTLIWSNPKAQKIVSAVVLADQEAKIVESRP